MECKSGRFATIFISRGHFDNVADLLRDKSRNELWGSGNNPCTIAVNVSGFAIPVGLFHRLQLAPENNSCNEGKECSEDGTYGGSFNPPAFRERLWILGLLGFCAIISGVTAYQISCRCPKAAWTPPVVFAAITIIAVVFKIHLARQMDRELGAAYGLPENVGIKPAIISQIRCAFISVSIKKARHDGRAPVGGCRGIRPLPRRVHSRERRVGPLRVRWRPGPRQRATARATSRSSPAGALPPWPFHPS